MTAPNRISFAKNATDEFQRGLNVFRTRNASIKCLSILLASIFLYSCAGGVSLADLQPGKLGGRTFSVEGKTYEQIWSAAQAAMTVEMDIVEQHKPSGVIKARVRSNKVVAFFITPTTPNAYSYNIKVLSKSYMQTDLVDRDWEPSVIEDFKSKLYSNQQH
jgi:hypothetical protein